MGRMHKGQVEPIHYTCFGKTTWVKYIDNTNKYTK